VAGGKVVSADLLEDGRGGLPAMCEIRSCARPGAFVPSFIFLPSWSWTYASIGSNTYLLEQEAGVGTP
jgi:hypothetical protein